ncbi:N-alpha-acetyl-L-2,4-diaminobutyric acid deacetylase [Smittium mucronatum]|uniref:N-alpha-acetyl-L-2,4-diaminobutyric acid deacetylase n=1 Tax=Smittium mucronatum TaxID=133383 RepID=A0A1R0H8U7_9FUNG|nr:N-alpha-acetyl-L-2,4-diaminobutyric acid deacetylase [Smittium mucronatum]
MEHFSKAPELHSISLGRISEIESAFSNLENRYNRLDFLTEIDQWFSDFTSVNEEIEEVLVSLKERISIIDNLIFSENNVSSDAYNKLNVKKQNSRKKILEINTLHKRSRKFWREAVEKKHGFLKNSKESNADKNLISELEFLKHYENFEEVHKLISSKESFIFKGWIKISEDFLGNNLSVPVITINGRYKGPVLGIVSTIHGNELNGIRAIHDLINQIDLEKVHGTIVAVPVLNIPGFSMSQRHFSDGRDLNRMMPGNKNGSPAEIYSYKIFNKLISKFNYLIDLHTASKNRVNSVYVRADLSDKTVKKIAFLQCPQIILQSTDLRGSLRGAAMDIGIPTITVEIGDPSVFQESNIFNSISGIKNILANLKMIPDGDFCQTAIPTVCNTSYWVHSENGGLLSVIPKVNEKVRKNDLIARVHDIFGNLIKDYFSPQNGIIIGKQSNPVIQPGSRIVHLGIMQ